MGESTQQGAPAPEVAGDWPRLAAFLVDAAIAAALCLVLRFIVPSLHWLGILYLVIKDVPSDGRSLGKRLFNLRVVQHKGEPYTLGAAVDRNLTLLPPAVLVELVVTVFSHDGRRIGDLMAGTIVRPGAATQPAPPPQVEPAPAPSPQPQPQPAPPRPVPVLKTAPKQPDPSPQPSPPGAAFPRIEQDEPAAEEPPKAGAAFPPIESPAQNDPSAPPRPAEPHEVLGVEPDADEDAIEDAYWGFAERYSEDAIKGLEDGELDVRCRELAERYAPYDLSGFTSPRDYDPSGDADSKRDYIMQFVIAVNAARDKLTG